MNDSSAAANSATPMNSLTRRERVEAATSDLHHDRKHEGPEPGTLSEEPLQVHANLLLDEARVRALLDTGALERRRQQRRNLLEQRLGARVKHESACNHVRCLLERARLFSDRHDRNDQP